MNFFAVINGIFSPEVTNKVALYVDEPAEKTNKAVQALTYTIFGGLLKRITSEIGVNQLFNYIQKGNYYGNAADNLISTFKDPLQIHALVATGNETISHLLPAMKSSIASMICSYTGIRNSSAISLLGLTSSIVLDVLGKQVREQKLDADKLAASLFDQRETFVQQIPENLLPQLIEKLGIQQIMAGMAMPARRNPESVSSTKATPTPSPITTVFDNDYHKDSGDSPFAKIGIGVLLVILLSVAGYFIYQNSQNSTNETSEVSELTDTTTESTSSTDTVARSLDVPVDTTRRTTPPATSTATSSSQIASPTTATPVAPTGGALSTQLRTYLSDPAAPKGRTFPLTGISFQPGSLTFNSGSETVIADLTSILKASPTTQIQLLGYANDAKGSITNKSLSFRRVNQIKQQLINAGIDYVRIDAVGRGNGVTKKVADTTANRTAGQTKIDLRIVIK